MLRARLLTTAIVLPCLIYLVGYAPEWGFSLAILSLTGIGLYEYFSLTRTQNSLPSTLGIVWGLLVALAIWTSNSVLVGAAFAAGVMLVFIASLRDRQPERGIRAISLTLLGVVYIGFLFPHFLWVHRGPNGTAWVFFIFLVAMLGDSAGYAIGRLWGKRQLLPHISPGKTIAGSVGATLGNCAAGLIAWHWLLPERSGTELVAVALITGLLAQLGDLCESGLKRACKVKDSGHFSPGHGGVLDRIDSLLFPVAFIYYYNNLLY